MSTDTMFIPLEIITTHTVSQLYYLEHFTPTNLQLHWNNIPYTQCDTL